MRPDVLLAALLFTAPSPQDNASACRFRDVVQAPDYPAVLDPATRRPPRLDYLLLPSAPWTVRAWVRVSASGEVTDVCVPDAPEGFQEAFAEAARGVRFAPARRSGRAVASVSTVLYEFGGRYEGRPHLLGIGTSTDVPWLERIAGSAEAALNLWRSRARRIGHPKDLRVEAFARLGEIETAESLAAQSRVRALLANRPLVPYETGLDVRWPYPGWHMGDYTPRALALTTTSAGARIAILTADLLGPPQVFLLRCEDDTLSRCTRPKPVTPWRWRYTKVRAALAETAPGRLRLDMVPINPEQAPVQGKLPGRTPPTPVGPATREIELAEVDRDSDADGWTDLEEQLLGMDATRRDSDGDGIDDAHDRAPMFGPAGGPSEPEDHAILRAAIFAVFGMSESRWVLFARNETVPRIEVPGLPAPVVFHRPLIFDDPAGHIPGGVFVTWKIVRRSATEAVVEISDWAGPMTAGGQEVFLRRIDGAWVVIARQTTWIS